MISQGDQSAGARVGEISFLRSGLSNSLTQWALALHGPCRVGGASTEPGDWPGVLWVSGWSNPASWRTEGSDAFAHQSRWRQPQGQGKCITGVGGRTGPAARCAWCWAHSLGPAESQPARGSCCNCQAGRRQEFEDEAGAQLLFPHRVPKTPSKIFHCETRQSEERQNKQSAKKITPSWHPFLLACLASFDFPTPFKSRLSVQNFKTKNSAGNITEMEHQGGVRVYPYSLVPIILSPSLHGEIFWLKHTHRFLLASSAPSPVPVRTAYLLKKCTQIRMVYDSVLFWL